MIIITMICSSNNDDEHCFVRTELLDAHCCCSCCCRCALTSIEVDADGHGNKDENCHAKIDKVSLLFVAVDVVAVVEHAEHPNQDSERKAR